MSRKSTIPDAVKRMIGDEALRDDAPRDDVVKRVRRRIRSAKYRVPARSTVEKEVSRVRSAAKKAGKDRKPLGVPWVLGAAMEREMTAEAIAAVVPVWRLTKLYLGEEVPLTFRECKWVTILHTLVEDTRNLRNWSLEYSLRQLTCEMTKTPLDTSDLDDAVLLGPWGFYTARQVGHVKTGDSPAGLGWMYPEPPKPAAHSTIKVVQAMEMILGKQLQPGTSDAEKLPALASTNPCEEALRVYALWLQHLSRGPRWNTLSTGRRRDIILRLRQWVKENSEYVQSTDDFGKCRNLKPTELLKKVGYKTR